MAVITAHIGGSAHLDADRDGEGSITVNHNDSRFVDHLSAVGYKPTSARYEPSTNACDAATAARRVDKAGARTPTPASRFSTGVHL